MAHILVSGGTGYLGSHVVKALVNRGDNVIVVKRQHSNLERLNEVSASIRTYNTDLLSLADIFAKETDVDTVIHTAVCYGKNGESDLEVFDANVRFAMDLLKEVERIGGTFMNAGTSLAKEVGSYALAKAQFLEWGRHAAARRRLRFMNLRLENTFGPGDNVSNFVPYLVRHCVRNVSRIALTLGEQERDFVYIDDVVRAFVLTLDAAEQMAPDYREFEVGTGVPVRIRDCAELVWRLSGSSAELAFGAIPYRKGDLMRSAADPSALMKLGWSSRITLDEGIQKMIAYERNMAGLS